MIKPATLAFALAAVGALGPAGASDLARTDSCADLRDGGPTEASSVRLACDCLPKEAGGPQSWWPLQGDAADYCGERNGGIDDTPGSAKSFSSLGIRQALDVSSGIFVNVPDAESSRGDLDGMTNLSLAVVVKTSQDSQPLLNKKVAGTKEKGVQSYAFRLENDFLYLDLFGEETGSKHESCISFRSLKRVKRSEMKREGGALVSVTWSGYNRAAFYLNRSPLGATHYRNCKESVTAVRMTDTPLWLGASAQAGKDGQTPIFAKGFQGQMRDAVLYRRALKPQEICQLADLLVPQDRPSACASPLPSSATATPASSGG